MLRLVPLLPASTSTLSTELLGLHASRVGDEECPVVRDELLLDLERVVGVVELGEVRNERARDGLADGVDLGGVSTTLDADTDVDGTEGLLASNQDGLVDLEAEDLRLEEVDGGAVNVDETTALLGVGNRSGGLPSGLVSLLVQVERGCLPCNIPSFCRKSERPSLLMP